MQGLKDDTNTALNNTSINCESSNTRHAKYSYKHHFDKSLITSY